ncbi:MAG: ankyrin repeat domain-containing protein [Nitrospirae bacterium]|nr:ankyrin repeat domain-containing protein [Nitrospirota bacterium]
MIPSIKNETNKNSYLILFAFITLLSLTIMNYGCASYKQALEANGIEYSGDSFIRQAARGNIDNVALFIKSGIDINFKDQTNSTALMRASANGQTEVVKLLIEKRADINAVDNSSSTALMHATYNNHADIVKLFIRRKADLNVKNKSNETALRYATRVNYVEIMMLLNNAGASE